MWLPYFLAKWLRPLKKPFPTCPLQAAKCWLPPTLYVSFTLQRWQTTTAVGAFKQYRFLILEFPRWTAQHGSHWTETDVSRAVFSSGVPKAESASLPFPAPRGHLHSLAPAPLPPISQASDGRSIPLTPHHSGPHSPISPWLTSASSSIVKEPCDYIGPTQITQDSLPV